MIEKKDYVWELIKSRLKKELDKRGVIIARGNYTFFAHHLYRKRKKYGSGLKVPREEVDELINRQAKQGLDEEILKQIAKIVLP